MYSNPKAEGVSVCHCCFFTFSAAQQASSNFWWVSGKQIRAKSRERVTELLFSLYMLKIVAGNISKYIPYHHMDIVCMCYRPCIPFPKGLRKKNHNMYNTIWWSLFGSIFHYICTGLNLQTNGYVTKASQRIPKHLLKCKPFWVSSHINKQMISFQIYFKNSLVGKPVKN